MKQRKGELLTATLERLATLERHETESALTSPDYLAAIPLLPDKNEDNAVAAVENSDGEEDFSVSPQWLSDQPEIRAAALNPRKQPRWRILLRDRAAVVVLTVIGSVAALFAIFSSGSMESTSTPVNFSEPGNQRINPSESPTRSVKGKEEENDEGSSSKKIVVAVVGLVKKPGLLKVDVAARVGEAIAAAGGVIEDADTLSLNIAQRLRDGDQILIGSRSAGLRSAVVSGGTNSTASQDDPAPNSSTGQTVRLNLNQATEVELDALPGVGPVTAKAILAWRAAHGKFSTVEQLTEIEGIGPAKLAKLRVLVTV